MIEFLGDPAVWVSFLTLTLLEIVLGVDNIIFLSILVSRLPKELQARARTLGLAFAMVTRIGLLFSITWLTKLTAPLFTVLAEEISGRDLILFAGGLFLMAKSVSEIHNALEGPGSHGSPKVKLRTKVLGVIVQIGIVDIIFSLDSVLTAVGLANHVSIMVAAIVTRRDRDDVPGRPDPRVHRASPDDQDPGTAFLILIGSRWSASPST